MDTIFRNSNNSYSHTMKEGMSIDEFIEIVHPKLKHKVSLSQDQIIGSELLLTGVKEVKGEKIIPNKMYLMDVPVVEKQDHQRRLRLAWLRGGKNAVRNYLTKWLKPEILEQVMTAL